MNDEKQQLIGRRIRTARKEAGLSQQKLGIKIGYSAMGVSHLENGNRKIKVEDLQKRALLQMTKEMKPPKEDTRYIG